MPPPPCHIEHLKQTADHAYLPHPQQVRFTGEEPTLSLATGSPVDVVTITSPLAGYYSDAFSFTYTVSPGDVSSDLSYTSTTALNLANSTIIVDESGDVANVTLPVVGTALSVTGGGGGTLVVDTSNVVMYVEALNEDDVYYAGESIFIQVMYAYGCVSGEKLIDAC